MPDRSIDPPTAAHKSYASLADVAAALFLFLDAERDWLNARRLEAPVDSTDAVCEHEAKMIRAADRALLALSRLDIGPPPAGFAPWLPNRIQSAIRRIKRALSDRLDLWGWSAATANNSAVSAALMVRRKAALHRLIDAAASWRAADDRPNDFVDYLADLAFASRVEPTMTPEAAEAAFDDLRREWFDRPLLVDAAPEIPADDRLAADAEAVREYFRSILPPADIPAYIAALKADCVIPADAVPTDHADTTAPTPARPKRKRRKPPKRAAADARVDELWKSGDFIDYQNLADHLKATGEVPGVATKADVIRAMDRHRKA